MEHLERYRWLDILTALGVLAKFLRNRHGPCPMCPRQPEVRMSMCPVLRTLGSIRYTPHTPHRRRTGSAQRPCLENSNVVTDGLRLARA